MVADERLADCQPFARLLWFTMHTIADRAGRLEDRPRTIRALALPYDQVDAEPLLEELATHGAIERYDVSGLRVIQIVGFLAQQNPHHREPDSKLPPKTESLGIAQALPRKARASRGKVRAEPQPFPAVPVPVSNPVSDPDPTAARTGRAPSRASHTRTRDRHERHVLDSGFDRFWAAYPRHEKRAAAEKAWRALQPDEALVARLMAAVSWQSASADWRRDGGRFVPHASSWLNGRRWEDERPAPSPPALDGNLRYDWRAECEALHAGRCGTMPLHVAKLGEDRELDAATA
jgi:hypothetical protein